MRQANCKGAPTNVHARRKAEARRSIRRVAIATAAILSLAVGALGFAPQTVRAAPQAQGDAKDAAARAEFIAKKVKPVLTEHCYDCHSTGTRAVGGLRVDDRAALLSGGKAGPAINLDKPDESLILVRILEADAKKRMPKGEDDPLPAENAANIKRWIADGAVWPEAAPAAAATAAPATETAKSGKLTKVAYPRPATTEQLAYFEKNVRPILVNNCYNCHSEAFKEAGGLRVDVGIAIFNGGNSGPAIIPGHPVDFPRCTYRAIRRSKLSSMPLVNLHEVLKCRL